jgi:excisionase family DNA binding protein
MNALSDRPIDRIDPTEISPEILRQLAEAIQADPHPALLIGHDGTRLELPPALYDLLVYVVQALERKQTLFLMPEDEAFTTQAAADFLGMSRPYLLRLLEAGKIPYHRVGTHRRILLRDLRAFQAERDQERRARLADLTKRVDAAGVYDNF